MSKLQISEFRDRIYTLISELPDGKVTTYGDLAALAGFPYAARLVGVVAHGGPVDLPWHRLVYSDGSIVAGFPGGSEAQRQLLEQDGISCDSDGRIVNFGEKRWAPGKLL